MIRPGQADPFEVLASAKLTANQFRVVAREGSLRLLGHQDDERLPYAALYMSKIFNELDHLTVVRSQEVIYASNVPEASRSEYPLDSMLADMPLDVGNLMRGVWHGMIGRKQEDEDTPLTEAQEKARKSIVFAKFCMGEAYVDLMQRPTDGPDVPR